MAAPGDNIAPLWLQVKSAANTATGAAIAAAIAASEAARADAAAAQDAARAEAARASEAALAKIAAAGAAALRNVERASASAHAEAAAKADARLAAALSAGPPEAALSASRAAERAPAGHASKPAAQPARGGLRREAQAAPEPPASPAKQADLPELLRDMALRGAAPNAAAAGAAAGAAVAAGAAAAQQFWAAALASATGAPTAGGTTVVQPFASGGYTWRIEGLTLERLRSYAPGKALESPPFAIDDTFFALRLYPGGDGCDASRGHASLSLALRTPGRRCAVEYELSALNQATGLPLARDAGARELGVDSDGAPLQFAAAAASSTRFLSHARAASFHADLLRGGALILAARVTLACAAEEAGAAPRPALPVPPRCAGADWRALLESGEGADVRFAVPDAAAAAAAAEGAAPTRPLLATFKAHRLVLLTRARGVRALLAGGGAAAAAGAGAAAAGAAIRVEGLSPAAFAAFLHYVYTEELESEPGEALAAELLAAADRFDVPRLGALAAAALAAALRVDNAAATLAAADAARAPALRRAAADFAAANADAVMATPGWEALCAQRPAMLPDLMRQMKPRGKVK